MANDLTTVFLPLIDETRMADHDASVFTLTSHTTDQGLDVQFEESAGIDQTIFMMAPGEVLVVLAGTTVTPANGPTVTAPADRHVLLMHVLTTFEWAPILTPTGQPVAEWWAVEGIWLDAFEAFLNLFDLSTLATARGYNDAEHYSLSVVGGLASVNVLLADGAPAPLATLDPAIDGVCTLGLRAWATFDSGLVELDAATALATFKPLAPSLETHPLLAAVLGDVSTRDVTIHVRFVSWSPNAANAQNEADKGAPQPVPDGSRISLQKRSAAGAYTPIVEAVVTAAGQVALVAPRAELNAVNLAAGERLVFRVDVPPQTLFTPQYQHKQTPRASASRLRWGFTDDAWVTEGRSTTDEAVDSLDFLVDYDNAVVGSTAQPLEYYAGVPVFLQVTYPVVYTAGGGAFPKFETLTRKAPKGLLVEIRDAATPAAQPPLGTFRTDEHGQIWGALLEGHDGLAIPLEILVKHEIEDADIGLPRIDGDVVEGGQPAAASYSSNKDARNAAAFAAPLKASVGRHNLGGLATVQVGFVTIGTGAVSDFSSTDGRHAGVVHALQQVRYVHQWLHHLTSGFTYGATDESWSGILARHNGMAGTWPSGPTPADQNFTIALPTIRVTQPLPGADEGRFGEADAVELPSTSPQKRRAWRLTLYGHDRFTMNSTLAGQPVLLDNKEQFWRGHTIWHEWTHGVLGIVLERLKNLDHHSYMVYSKDASTSGRVHSVILDGWDATTGLRVSGGWSTLDEALAAIPEAVLRGTASGLTPTYDPSPIAAPRQMVVDIDAAGNRDGIANPASDLNLDQGLLVDLNRLTGPPTLNDQRLGLRVPLAFTWALWTALQQVGGFNETLEAHVTGIHPLNDLKDAVGYLSSAKATQVFQALVWGPLVASRTPDIPGSPPQWNDLTAPAFGPSTFSVMQALQTQFWNGLSAADRRKVKDLFGSADAPLSFYVWFSFP